MYNGLITVCKHARMAKCYFELVFHCLRLDNWCAVDVAVNLRMFLGSLDKEQYYIVWFLGDIVWVIS